MYAIIETGGKQYWVSPKDTIKVEKLKKPVGENISFVALWAAEESAAPVALPGARSTAKGAAETKADKKAAADTKVPAATVTAQVVRHFRDRKVLVFKMKPKKKYRKMQGHRQNLTELKIESIKLN